MKNRKPPVVKEYETYKVTRYAPKMAEIEFFDDSGFVSLVEVDRIVKKHFPRMPREHLSFLISDKTGKLLIGSTEE